ncbi:hypothetical protein F0Q45_03370 [Mycobacterium simiae]|uniref:Uncharacterized protein n=1 Tax=Mycobacterium simiae TaxID=1784 RepID=A0A5B1BUL7_MYCSI|nr:hypothetical protein F0Q45_03370 [Mycobacterium simiae]
MDAEQAPVGGIAELPKFGQAGQPFGDAEVVGVVDGGFGAQRHPLLVILLDLGGLVVDVQRRDDTGGSHGAGGAGGLGGSGGKGGDGGVGGSGGQNSPRGAHAAAGNHGASGAKGARGSDGQAGFSS